MLMIFLSLLLIGIFLLYTSHYYFFIADTQLPEPHLKLPIQGPICGILNIPIPSHGYGTEPYFCYDA